MKLIFLGGQGSGKSTQAKMLVEKLDLPLVEMGQLLRNRTAEDNQEAKQIRSALKIGILVKDEIVISTLKARIEKSDCRSGYILDGYPRNNAQLKGLPSGVDKVYYINISDDEAVKRLTKRGRSDDTKEAIAKRLEIYHQQTEPLLDVFRQRGILDEVDGERTIEEVHKDILERVEKLQAKQNV